MVLSSELSSKSLMHESHSYLKQPTMAFLAVTSRLLAKKKEQLPSDVASESLPALPSGGPSDDESLPSIAEHDSLPERDYLPSSAAHESLPSGGPFSSISPEDESLPCVQEVLPSSAEEDEVLPSSEEEDPAADVLASCPHAEESLQLISS